MSVADTIWFGLGAAIMLVGTVLITFSENVRAQRRIYWSSWLLGTAVIAQSTLRHGWGITMSFAAVFVGVATIGAYTRTPYLKINGRIYSYRIALTRPDPTDDGSPAPPVIVPPDAYRGMVTASTHWWSLVCFSAAAGGTGLLLGVHEASLGLVAFVTVLFGTTGYLDAKDRFPIARNQRLQAGIAVITSIPVFLVPPISYAIGYYIDKPRRRS